MEFSLVNWRGWVSVSMQTPPLGGFKIFPSTHIHTSPPSGWIIFLFKHFTNHMTSFMLKITSFCHWYIHARFSRHWAASLGKFWTWPEGGIACHYLVQEHCTLLSSFMTFLNNFLKLKQRRLRFIATQLRTYIISAHPGFCPERIPGLDLYPI